jgi:hypothetical protein
VVVRAFHALPAPPAKDPRDRRHGGRCPQCPVSRSRVDPPAAAAHPPGSPASAHPQSHAISGGATICCSQAYPRSLAAAIRPIRGDSSQMPERSARPIVGSRAPSGTTSPRATRRGSGRLDAPPPRRLPRRMRRSRAVRCRIDSAHSIAQGSAFADGLVGPITRPAAGDGEAPPGDPRRPATVTPPAAGSAPAGNSSLLRRST